jgi:hypothetical protein
MQIVKALFALAFFISLASSADNSSYMAGAKLFGYQVVPQGIGFYVENFTCNGKEAYAIVSYDEPEAFFVQSSQKDAVFPGLSPITDIAAIAENLECYYVKDGHTPDLAAGFSAVHDEIAKLEDDDDRGEAGCRILLGTDRSECGSFETCQVACYSVTSFCQPVALGAGRSFVNEIWAFENNSRALDRAYAGENRAYAAFAKNSSQENALAYLSALNATNAAVEAAAVSPLFYDYSFCFSPDYPIYSMYQQKTRAERQYRDSAVFYGIAARSAEIANRTADAVDKKTKRRLPEIRAAPEACAGGACRNGTRLYDEAEEQAQAKTFIAGLMEGVFSFLFGWAQQK